MVNEIPEELEKELVTAIQARVSYVYEPKAWLHHVRKTLKGAQRTIWFIQALNIATYVLGFGLIVFAAVHAARVIPPFSKAEQGLETALNTPSDSPAQESSAKSGTSTEETKPVQNPSPGKSTPESPSESSTSTTEPKIKEAPSGDKGKVKKPGNSPAQGSPAKSGTPTEQESPAKRFDTMDVIISGASVFSGILITFLNFFLVNPGRRIQKVYTDIVQMGMALQSYTLGVEKLEKAFSSNPDKLKDTLTELKDITKELVNLIEATAEVKEEELLKELQKYLQGLAAIKSRSVEGSGPTPPPPPPPPPPGGGGPTVAGGKAEQTVTPG